MIFNLGKQQRIQSQIEQEGLGLQHQTQLGSKVNGVHC